MIYEEDSITQNLLIELHQFYNDLIEGTVDYFDDDKDENENGESYFSNRGKQTLPF